MIIKERSKDETYNGSKEAESDLTEGFTREKEQLHDFMNVAGTVTSKGLISDVDVEVVRESRRGGWTSATTMTRFWRV